MDQRLLSALDNLGVALEEIADALNSKQEAKSSTGAALKSGDFGKQLESINKNLQSIKADTQEILKQQKTIMSMSKTKDTERDKLKKETPVEELGKDKKKESAFKKGIGTILLIAVAVLAIGMAFKLVGKIDFVSVITLGLAMYMISLAFEKVARLNLSLKQSFHTSLTMVIIAAAVTASSWILRAITPVGALQLLTAVGIAGVFATIGMSLEKLGIGIAVFDKIVGKKAPIIVPLIMVAISAAIAASSYVLRFVKPIGLFQLFTAIAIAGVFAVIGISFQKIAIGIDLAYLALGKSASWKMPLILVAIATAITASSWVLSLVRPIGFVQALTAIAISLMFMIIGFVMEKIAMSIVLIDRLLNAKKAAWLLPLVLVAIATAITASSWILSIVKPMTFVQFLTALAIALLFALMSYVMPDLAIGVFIIEKALGKKGLAFMPLVFVAIALAVMVSSHILAKTASIDFKTAINIAAFGIGLGLLMLAMVPSVLLIGAVAASGVGAGAIALGVAMIPLIALAVVVSSHILAKGKYDKYPSLGWVISVGVVMTGFAAAVVALGAIAITGLGAVAILAGAALVPLVALSVVETDKILRKGKYDKYPGAGWILSVGATMIGFGTAVVALGALAITGIGLIAVLAGVELVPKIAQAVVDTDEIISKGKYTKYPGWKWIASVGVTMTGFGAAVVTLGGLAITGLGLGALAIWAGTKMVPMIAQAVVDTDEIISKGKYTKYPGWKWIASVGVTMTGFGAAVVTLGGLAITGLGLGALAIWAGTKMVTLIAQAIVDTDTIISKGKYTKYPGWRWIASVGVTMTGFGAAVVTLGGMAITGFGLGALAIWAGTKAITMIAQAIVDTDKIIAKGNYSKYPKWGWAASVGTLMTVFGLAVLTLGSFIVGSLGLGYVALKAGQSAVGIIAQSVIDTANIFAKAGDIWKAGPTKEWAEGVAIALGAFSPVYGMMMKGGVMGALFGSGPSPSEFAEGIRVISQGIIDAANFFASPEASASFTGGPKKEWAEGVGQAIGAFAPIYSILASEKGFFGTGVSINDFKNAINTICWSIISAAKIFSKYGSSFENPPPEAWSKGVSKALGAFSPIFKTLMKDGILEGGTKVALMISSVTAVSKAIVSSAKIFGSVKNWMELGMTGVPSKKWSWRTKLALQSFSHTARSLKAKEKQLYIAERTAFAISRTANIFYRNRRTFSDRIAFDVMTWSKRLLGRTGIFHEFVNLTKWLKQQEKQMTSGKDIMGAIGEGLLAAANPIGFIAMKMTGPSSKSTGDIVADTALKIVRVARIIFQNKKFFEVNIDPNYMKKVGKNMLDFNNIVKELAKQEDKGFFKNIGSSIDSMFGTDPISQIAARMVTLAKGYDALATALMKLGGAMRMLKLTDARQLGGITKSITEGKSPKLGGESSRDPAIQQVRTQTTKFVESRKEGVGMGKSRAEVNDEKMIKRLEEMIKILRNIDRSVSSVDDYISDQSGGKYPTSGGSLF